MPGNPEAAFWTAVSLGARGNLDDARPLLASATSADPGWAELLRRLGDRRLSDMTPELVDELLRSS
jgi:hypothetical protein